MTRFTKLAVVDIAIVVIGTVLGYAVLGLQGVAAALFGVVGGFIAVGVHQLRRSVRKRNAHTTRDGPV